MRNIPDMKIIDVHAHDGVWDLPEPHNYDLLGETMPDFIADLDKDNVSNCFISSVEALIGDLIKGNELTYADASEDERIFAYTYYDPTRVDESLREIEKYKNNPKFIGFKSRPEYHKIDIDDSSYVPLLEAAEHLDKPILLHCFPISDAYALANALKSSTAKVIMVHACNDKYHEAMSVINKFENVFVEPVTSNHYPGKIRSIINTIGYERLLFGSDYGLMSRERIIRTYTEAYLSSIEHEAIFSGNSRELFKL